MTDVQEKLPTMAARQENNQANDKVCIIGAGPSGMVAAKALKDPPSTEYE